MAAHDVFHERRDTCMPLVGRRQLRGFGGEFDHEERIASGQLGHPLQPAVAQGGGRDRPGQTRCIGFAQFIQHDAFRVRTALQFLGETDQAPASH